MTGVAAPSTAKVNRLFVYGELCKPNVVHELLGRVPPAEPAVLESFARRFDPSTGYFRATAQVDAVIVGILLGEIEPAELALLDTFENVDGGEYRRVCVRVRTVAGRQECPAWIYVGG